MDSDNPMWGVYNPFLMFVLGEIQAFLKMGQAIKLVTDERGMIRGRRNLNK